MSHRALVRSTSAIPDGYVATYSATDGYWEAMQPSSGSFTAGGDLTGSSSSQQVVALTGSAGTLPIASTAAILEWTNATTNPTLHQADNTTNSATAQSLAIQAQNATGTTSTGGNLILESGTGTSSNGSVVIKTGANDTLTITDTVTTIKTIATVQNGDPTGLGYIADFLVSFETTDATPIDMFTYLIPDNSTILVDFVLTAMSADHTKGAAYKRTLAFKCFSVTSALGASTIHDGQTDEDDASWDVNITYDGAAGGNIHFTLTGDAAQTVAWSAAIRVQTTTV